MNEDKLQKKYKVFEHLLRRKKALFEDLSNFQQEQVESINEADMDQDSIMENQTESMLREIRVENASLDHLKEEVNYLEDFKSFQVREEVGPSTLVKTSMGNFIVAVPEHLLEVDGEKFTGISTKSPLYEALEGKREGDTIRFNGQQVEINMVV